jgi:hypothetical protein
MDITPESEAVVHLLVRNQIISRGSAANNRPRESGADLK